MPDMQRIALIVSMLNLGMLATTLGFNRLAVAPDGEAAFRLMDQTGAIGVKLGAGTEGSGFVLANDQTEPGINMLATDKATRVTLKSQSGVEKVIAP
jgi:hypothetical protein